MAATTVPIRAVSAALVILVLAGACAAPAASDVAAPPSEAPLASLVATPATSTDVTTATPSLPVDSAAWPTFTSERYGYTVAYPPTWKATAATGDWSFETSRRVFNTPDADQFIDRTAGYPILFSAFAAAVPEGMTHEDWITAFYDGTTEGCDPMSDATDAVVDGLPAVIAHDCNDSLAFVSRGEWMQVFAVWRPNQGRLLTEFLESVAFAE